MPFIPLEIYANNPSTTVSSGGTSAPGGGTTETWTVTSSAGFPAAEMGATQFHVSDPIAPSEIITVANVSGITWTVVRGAESSTPVTHTAGFTVVQVVTAGALTSAQYHPWEFPVAAYNAQGDGKIGTGGTGTSGTSAFSDAGASFVNAAAPSGDVGKCIIINQGTSTTNPFCGTIIAVNSPTSVTLSGNLAANAANAPYIYGTDDTAAINAAVTAAAAFATARDYKAQVVFEPLNYMLGSLTQTTNGGAGPVYNTQIPVPFGTQFGQKLVIDLVGIGDASEPDYWETVIPSLQGTCLVSTLFATGQPDATYGAQSVIGGPTTSTGLGPGNFANALLNVNGITIVCPWNSQQMGCDGRRLAQMNVPNGSYLAFAGVNYSAQTGAGSGGATLAGSHIVTNGQSVGWYFPIATNNDNCNAGQITAEGAAIGIVVNEHFTAQRVACIYCDHGVNVGSASGAALHGATFLYVSVEACNVALFGSVAIGGQFPVNIGLLDTEVINTWDISDTNSGLTGTVYHACYTRTTMNVTGASGLNIVNTRLPPGPWAGAPAAPASTVTQQNTAFRPAVIYLSATTGITVVTVGPLTGTQTTTGLVAGNAVTTQLRVPSGHWYSVTYGGTLTTTWILE